MEKIHKVNIKKINYDDEYGNTRLEFNINGPNIDYIVMNTIRRTIFAEIPIYAFNEFKFEKSTAVFHRNYLKLRFRNMPVWGIENNIDFYNVNEKKNIDFININYENNADDVELDVEQNVDSSTLNQLTMYLTFKNKSMNIVTVTTDHAKYYYKEKQIENPYKIPVPLVKLQPLQEISFSAITQLGIEEEDTMYSPVSITTYIKKSNSDFDMILESRGQITEVRIIEVAIMNIIRRLNNFIKTLYEDKRENLSEIEKTKLNIKTDTLQGLILINNEDHTLGNLVARGLQKHIKISFASYNLPHPLDKKVIFHYVLKEKGNIKNIFKDVVDYYIALFTNIKKDISNL
jgi:DNA-directed RNA polymerase subunit L